MLVSQARIDEAIKLARASDGAHTIHNELTLKQQGGIPAQAVRRPDRAGASGDKTDPAPSGQNAAEQSFGQADGTSAAASPPNGTRARFATAAGLAGRLRIAPAPRRRKASEAAGHGAAEHIGWEGAMRIVFGIVGLLITLAILAVVVRTQLQAVHVLPNGPALTSGASSQAGAVPGDPGALNVRQQSQAIQNKVADDVNRLMQQAPARAEGQ
jgi:hypothetical protein